MSLLTDRRAFLPLCLTLGALLCALPALADPTAVPAALKAQTITLQHVVLGDILNALHWDRPDVLPSGVTQITFRPDTNSLSVVATPAGLVEVRRIVTMLDVAPRQVQIKFALAHAADADLKASGLVFESAPLPSNLDTPIPDTRYATGGVALFLQTLTKQGAVTQAPVITTTNNAAASVTVSTLLPSQVVLSETFAVTPRINSDDSVTLALHPVLLDGTVKREIKTLRTVKSGDTLLIVLAPNARTVGGKSILLFVTPTIISTDKSTATMTVK